MAFSALSRRSQWKSNHHAPQPVIPLVFSAGGGCWMMTTRVLFRHRPTAMAGACMFELRAAQVRVQEHGRVLFQEGFECDPLTYLRVMGFEAVLRVEWRWK